MRPSSFTNPVLTCSTAFPSEVMFKKPKGSTDPNFKCDVYTCKDREIDYHMTLQPQLKRKITSGFQNQGNTCFFNSVMQCLVHTVSLHQYILKDQAHAKFCHSSKDKRCLVCSFHTFLQDSTKSSQVDMSQISKFLNCILPHYVPGRQEDAQEFLLGFIDGLITSYFDHPNPSEKYVIANQSKTPIFKIFGFQSRSQVLCQECG